MLLQGILYIIAAIEIVIVIISFLLCLSDEYYGKRFLRFISIFAAINFVITFIIIAIFLIILVGYLLLNGVNLIYQSSK